MARLPQASGSAPCSAASRPIPTKAHGAACARPPARAAGEATNAFEALGCVRVQFATDELNERSRAAIARLGAKQEGILRNERIMPDGRRRNSVRFSIIDSEWPDVKAGLEHELAAGS